MSDKTEAATPRRLEQLRSDGRVPRSPELGSAIGLLAGLIVLQNAAPAAGNRMTALLTGVLSDFGKTGRAHDIDVLWAQQALGKGAETWLFSMLPLLVVLPVLGIAVGFSQGAIVSFKSMMHFDSLNPFSGIKRLFSMQALMNLARSLAKVGLVGALTWRALLDTAAQLPEIDGSTDPRAMAGFIGQAILNVGMPAAEVLLVLAIADYAYQRWQFARSARMSLQEVKDEHKQQEGDPMLKGQIRAKQRAMGRQRRQMEDVPKATVVVTNPTHIAIALQYERGMASPKVLAVGTDLIAEKIKKIAREASVPCIENVPLARGLYKAVQVGDEIPIELYQAVAEVLAYVYSLKRRRRSRAQ